MRALRANQKTVTVREVVRVVVSRNWVVDYYDKRGRYETVTCERRGMGLFATQEAALEAAADYADDEPSGEDWPAVKFEVLSKRVATSRLDPALFSMYNVPL